jgi:tungstate transport system ATP-binding protein
MIELEGIYKNFGEKEVLRDVTLTIEKGEIFTLIGPSGTGKSTILRLINLLDIPSEGKIFFDGIDTSRSEKTRLQLRRRMSMVFQKPAALRGDVFENIAVPLKFRKTQMEDIQMRVPEVLELVGLSGFERRKATTLSGGEMQRVAIARAIITRPEVLLLDEPTANLDPVSTEKVENLINTINTRFGTTIVLSTHDMVQGQRLAHRIAVILNRTIGQVGTSREIFYHPENRDVAHMVGVENILNGQIMKNDEGLASIDVDGHSLVATSAYPAGSRVTVYLRPEDVVISLVEDGRSSMRNQLHGRITKVVPMGPMVKVRIDCGVRFISVITRRSYDELELELGRDVNVSFKATAVHVVKSD